MNADSKKTLAEARMFSAPKVINEMLELLEYFGDIQFCTKFVNRLNEDQKLLAVLQEIKRKEKLGL